MKVGVLLSGCGVYDGVEIQEAVASMILLEKEGLAYQCLSIDKNQFHVVNHLNGEEQSESRNMLVEAARIARGNVVDIRKIDLNEFSALLIPGGFGCAKNWTTWAFHGPNGTIDEDVKQLVLSFHQSKKPILALCVSPVVLGKAFEGTEISLNLTLGTDAEKTPYDIDGFNAGMQQTGAVMTKKGVREFLIDENNKVISAPCYMQEAKISEIYDNIAMAVCALKSMI